MPVSLYMDVHIPKAMTAGLRLRGVDVVTAQEDAAATLSDTELLDRVNGLGRVLFTFDGDFLIEADRRLENGIEFNGIIYARSLRVSVGDCINGLELIAKAGNMADLVNRVVFLPF